MSTTRVLFVCLCFCYFVVECKKFETRCKLVRELLRIGVPNDIFLGQWVCLAEKVSNRDTKALTVSPSGKKSYGIFQIPSRWCKEGRPGGECNVRCESLLDDDIRDDVACAYQIFDKEGFKYWTKWETRCKNDNFITNEIYKCPDLQSPRSSPERVVTRSVHSSLQFWLPKQVASPATIRIRRALAEEGNRAALAQERNRGA